MKNVIFSLHFLDKNLFKTLLSKNPSNNICADCGKESLLVFLFYLDPNWISINTGAVICINCSGIHRKLGVHISKVRSLDLDFVPPELQLVIFLLYSLVDRSKIRK